MLSKAIFKKQYRNYILKNTNITPIYHQDPPLKVSKLTFLPFFGLDRLITPFATAANLGRTNGHSVFGSALFDGLL